MTRPVTPVHPTGQAPCQPIAKRHAAMEPLACKDQMRTQAPCQNEMQPQRTSLRVQVCNAGRRLHAARVRGAGVRQKHGSGHATHTAMASAALSSHSHVHARTGIISAGYGPMPTSSGRPRTWRRCVRLLVPQFALTKFARILSTVAAWTGREEHGRHAATRLQRRLGMCSLLKWVQVTQMC